MTDRAMTPEKLAEWQARVTRAKQHMVGDIRALAKEIVPRGKKTGSSWIGLPPHRASDNDSCFAIYVSGPKVGGWKDFVSGETGDVFRLVQLKFSHATFADTVRWAEDRYGLRSITADERERLTREREVRQSELAAEEQEVMADKIRKACHMFSKADPEIRGTVVEAYLISRGIWLDQLPHRDTRWLRFQPRMPYWKLDDRPEFPAMLAGLTDAHGVMRALHITYLRPDGRGKAPVPKAKLMFGPMKGCMIRINHGSSGLDPEAAAHEGLRGPVLVAEGIEDALTLAMMVPENRAWAAGSLANYLEIPDLPCVQSFVLARDNDWGKAQAKSLFDRALARLKGFRKPAAAVASIAGKDFNDQLMEDLDNVA